MQPRSSAILIGLALLGSAGWMARRPYLVLTTWTPADAVILTKPEAVRHAKSNFFRFTFGYAASETNYTGIAETAQESGVKDIQPGSHHPIRYDPAHPSSAVYEPGLMLFGLSLIFGGIGFVFLLVAGRPDPAVRLKPTSVVSAFNLNAPPRGAWFAPLPGGFNAGAITRDRSVYVLAPVTLFLFGLAWGFYPGGVSVVMLLLALVMLYLTVQLAAGRVRLTLDMDRLTIFTGIGRIGSGTTYQWSSFRSVREEGTRENATLRIVLEGTRRVEFGENLSDERREFLVNVLQTMLPAHQTNSTAATPEIPELTGKGTQRTCTNCGGVLPANAHFCTVCGKQVDAVPVPLKADSFEDGWNVPPELLLPAPRPVRGSRITPGQRIAGIVFMAGVATLLVLGAGFFTGGVAVALFAAWAYHVSSQHKWMLKWGKPARAVVAEVTPIKGRWSTIYSTIFEYRDHAGGLIRSSRQRLGVEFAVGRVMTVLYDPKKPSSCVMYPVEGLEIALPHSRVA